MSKTVPAVRVSGEQPGGFPQRPGEFAWRPDALNPTRMIFCCPCGCEAIGAVNVQPEDQFGNGQITKPWKWDGNLDKPTIAPSIMFMGGCGWHGHLVDGVFKEC